MNISMLQQHAHCAWATTIIKLIIFVTYGVCWVCLNCHNPPNSDRTTGSLSCAQMSMQVIAHGGCRTPKESLHWKLTRGRKSLAASGNQTCVSGLVVWCSNQLSYIPSPVVCDTNFLADCQGFSLGTPVCLPPPHPPQQVKVHWPVLSKF